MTLPWRLLYDNYIGKYSGGGWVVIRREKDGSATSRSGSPPSGSQVGADIGGTFTDIVWRGSEGDLRFDKRLSTPDAYSQAVVEGMAAVGGPTSFGSIDSLGHASTVATNAVLGGHGSRVGLITTEGFRDVLEFGRLQRSDLYDLTWEKPTPLVPRRRRCEVRERVAADGNVLVEVEEKAIESALTRLQEEEVEAIAVCLINAYANPSNEQKLGEYLRSRTQIPVVLSSDLLRESGEFERTSTCAVNAYVLDIASSYLKELVSQLRERKCKVEPAIMQSNGGTISEATAQEMPVRMIESGPAAGVIAAASLARSQGIDRVISFDMGGTTAKACLIDDYEPSMSDEYWVGAGINREGSRLLRGKGYPIRVPTIDIAEVSAGGGSVGWLDAGGALKVGPRSAGAMPGPACYGLGGVEPTFTDSCVVLGIFGRETIGSDQVPIRADLAASAIQRQIAEPLGISVQDAARGIYEVTISNLMRAIRAVTVEIGKDPSDYSLVAFGGAGGMVAAELARQLNVRQVLIPPLPGVFSALGLLAAPARRDNVIGIFEILEVEAIPQVLEAVREAEMSLTGELLAEGHPSEALHMSYKLDVHYRGQSDYLSIDWNADESIDPEKLTEDIRTRFRAEYQRLHSHLRDDSEIEVLAVRVSATAITRGLPYEDIAKGLTASGLGSTEGIGTASRPLMDLSGKSVQAAVLNHRGDLSNLPVSERRDIIVDEPDTTIFIPRTFSAEMDELGALVLTPKQGVEGDAPSDLDPTPYSLEVFTNSLATVNDEMTAHIARTAQSEIAKDILDFATAICDARGRVVSQGLTMVLHAGAIPAAIDFLVKEQGGDFRPGDVFLSNDPYLGGSSHLVDMFVIRPIFADGHHIGFAGAVVHTSDMGGRVAGGNAADSTEIFQEGLRLPPVKICEADEIVRSIERILEVNVRVPSKVLGDLHALIQACRVADTRLNEMVQGRGVNYVTEHMDGVLEHATRLFKERVKAFPDGRFSFRDVLDDDGVGNGPIGISVAIERREDKLVVDFNGSDPAVPGATNSPWPFTESAVYYTVKAALGADIPNNSGYFDLIDVRFPEGSVVSPAEPTATAAKGVVAFRVVDALFGALAQALPGRIPAAGDGGAAIIVFAGRESYGAFVAVDVVMSAWGGRANQDGIDGISSSAVNGRNTPVEVTEASYPLRVLAYELVSDSGGSGQFRGGLATRRVYKYLGDKPAVLQVRSDRNPTAPWGLAGGSEGTVSSNTLVLPSGEQVDLATKFTMSIEPGSIFEHLTASGGGYGPSRERNPSAIREDIADDKVTMEHAREQFGWSE